MWSGRYFAARYWAALYWPRVSSPGEFIDHGEAATPLSIPLWTKGLYKPLNYKPLRYSPLRFKPPRYRKPF